MDPVLYITAAVILHVLLVIYAADVEQRRDVVQAAVARPRVPEERGAGMPRRRRNMAAVMAHRRPQAEERERDQDQYEEDTEEPQNVQPTVKVGAKKQRKLEEKQAKKAQREEEAEQRAKEEQERREEEDYQKLKAEFIIEDQGEEEQLTEDQVTNPTLSTSYLY
uniref:DDRGK domain-containing protein 1 n=1 Tax=Neogobius melanostomus TaxID=47308 RepID=A0A8C6U391_9GOBI